MSDFVNIMVPVSDGDSAFIQVEGRFHPAEPDVLDTPGFDAYFEVFGFSVLEVHRWNDLVVDALDIDNAWFEPLFPRIASELANRQEQLLESM